MVIRRNALLAVVTVLGSEGLVYLTDATVPVGWPFGLGGVFFLFVFVSLVVQLGVGLGRVDLEVAGLIEKRSTSLQWTAAKRTRVREVNMM